MNTHDDLLNNDEMCSFYEDDIENMCSNKEYDACGGNLSFVKDILICVDMRAFFEAMIERKKKVLG